MNDDPKPDEAGEKPLALVPSGEEELDITAADNALTVLVKEARQWKMYAELALEEGDPELAAGLRKAIVILSTAIEDLKKV